ncbi:MAG: N-acetylmuramoyl-L-alanine amidase, partial [Bacteroidota bacterium]|nr:N-acetylmuramoyl-L-alanine amidase [Bacteroidota bacterium]
EAGGTVFMSRTTDSTVELKPRSVAANNSGADIFISVHHNAPADDNDEWINYTSTYYHALPSDYEYEPCQNDIAKYIQRDISYAVRNPGGPASFDGTYSDYNIYPKAGFSVLRLTKIPAVLVECAFVTNNYQENKLAVDQYNRIEAWGIFKGLCRYFSQSIPTISSADAKLSGDSKDLVESFYIKDTVGIKSTSIVVYIDSVKTNNFTFVKNSGLLNVKTDDLQEGDHIIRIIAENKNGNHSFPFYKKFQIVK